MPSIACEDASTRGKCIYNLTVLLLLIFKSVILAAF